VEDECPDGVLSSSVNDEGGVDVVCAGVENGLSLAEIWPWVMGAVLALAVVALVVNVSRLSAKRARALQEAGLNPHLTGEEQIAAAHRARSASAPAPSAPTPARGVEERLAELDDLLRREKITADEHARARLHVLTDD
jgi:hypothetical protein